MPGKKADDMSDLKFLRDDEREWYDLHIRAGSPPNGGVLTMLNRLAELRQELAEQWISVSERLPEPNPTTSSNSVMVETYNKSIQRSEYAYRFQRYWYTSKCWGEDDGATHWRPLPAPPEEPK
jgi:hypothetical protein